MSIRNYNAWIKAARKASAKTGGLSLPAARKAYRKMSERLDRPLKGTDVRKHPRIFRESIRGSAKGSAKRKPTEIRGKVPEAKPSRPVSVAGRPVERRTIRSLKEWEQIMDLLELEGEVEYASTAEYKKKG